MRFSFLLSVFNKRYDLKTTRGPLKGGDKINLGGWHAEGFKAQVQD